MIKPKITIIIPIHNGADYLAECLASIEYQSLKELEILCVDDASTDESARLVEEFAAHDARFILLNFTENKGAAAARNYALEHAKGDYIAFMDSDDFYPESTSLQKLYTAAIKHEVSIAGGSFCEYNEQTKTTVYDFSYDEHLAACLTFTQEGPLSYREWQGDYGYTRFIYKRTLLQEKQIRFPLIKRHEDPVFFVHAMLAAQDFWVIPDLVYTCRVGHKPRNISTQAAEEAFQAICELIELSIEQDLPKLREHQYSLLKWYLLSTDIDREYGSWAEIANMVTKQAKDSVLLRLKRPKTLGI